MGWCGATDIMDAAVAGAEAAVRAVLEEFAPPGSDEAVQAKVDDALRPFVAKVARQLRDGDWDCIEESDYFERFRQEMLGHDDQEHAAWLREELGDAVRYSENDEVARWADLLKAHTEKMKAGNG